MICAISSVRPISAATLDGRSVPALRAVTSARELRRQVRVDELVQVLGPAEVPQVVLAEVAGAPAPAGSRSMASAAADAESSTWPPCPAAMIRAARFTVVPK